MMSDDYCLTDWLMTKKALLMGDLKLRNGLIDLLENAASYTSSASSNACTRSVALPSLFLSGFFTSELQDKETYEKTFAFNQQHAVHEKYFPFWRLHFGSGKRGS